MQFRSLAMEVAIRSLAARATTPFAAQLPPAWSVEKATIRSLPKAPISQSMQAMETTLLFSAQPLR